MSNQTIDIEKAEGELQRNEPGDEYGPSTQLKSPTTSQASTVVVGHGDGLNKWDSHQDAVGRPGAWARGCKVLSSSIARLLEWLRGSEEANNGHIFMSKVRKIHEQPRGYPELATYLDCDESFMMYRRFGYLQSRLLLDRQEELRILERNLDAMEEKEHQQTPRRLRSAQSSSEEKKSLLDQIEGKWNAYCQLVGNASAMNSLNKPTDAEWRSVSGWMWNKKPIQSAEAGFLQCREDLITMRPGREHAWLDSGVEKTLQWCGWSPVRRAFQAKDTRAKSDGLDGTVLLTRARVEACVVTIITLMILALLVLPVWLLYWLSESRQMVSRTSFECIGVLLVSTLAFSACLSLFTRARRHEILGASAAYCAVLVVFIGNIGQHLGPG